MRTQINLRPDELRLVRSILAAHVPGYEVRVFGSRITGNAKPASDLDLCVVDVPPLSAGTVRRLQTSFSDSTLPFKVDLSCWSNLNEEFRRLVDASSVLLEDTSAEVRAA